MPTLLVSVAVRPVTVVAPPWIVNGKVSVNWLPNWLEAAEPYQAVKAVVSGTVTEFDCSVAPEAAVNWNVACVISRGVE